MSRAEEIIAKAATAAGDRKSPEHYPAKCGYLSAEVEILCHEIEKLKREIARLREEV